MALVASAMLSGCGPGDGSGPDATPVATQSAQGMAATRVAVFRIDAGVGELGERARQAMADSRVHSPAGDSAIDLYLALREQRPDDPRAAAALAELSPYMVIATEQAIGLGDVYEAERLLALLLRMDAKVPAASRLREALAVLHQARQEEMARVAREARLKQEPDGDERVARTTEAPAAEPSPATPSPSIESAQESITGAVVASIAATPPAAKPKPASPAVPRLVRDAAPDYPLHALRRGIEGRVRVAFTIEADGSVSAARSVAATPQGVFEEAAVAAATQWRFEPGTAAVSTSRMLNFNLPGR